MSIDDSTVKVLGKYVLKELIGKGGMGTVWLSSHTRLDLPVAVKILNKGLAIKSTEYVQRFIEEGRTAAIINHPNIVRIYDADHDQEQHYLVMEYIDGCDIRELAKKQGGSLPVSEVLELAIKISEALKDALAVGIVHRDIKPENIMVTNEGKIKLADLGIAKRVAIEQEGEAYALGTPHYISPEQALDARSADHRSDIYSLGATMYHLLTGEVPFDDTCSKATMMKHLQEPLVHPRSIKVDLPDNICAVVCKMMEKNPGDRYLSYSALLEDLHKIKYNDAAVDSLSASIRFDSLCVKKEMSPSRGSTKKTAIGRKEKGLSTGQKISIALLVLIGLVLGGILIMPLLNPSDKIVTSKGFKQKNLKGEALLYKPIFWASFDEERGNVVLDETSTHNGKSNQEPKSIGQQGAIGKALEFNGISNFVSFGNYIPVSSNEARSVSMWIYPRKLSGLQSILCYGGDSKGKKFRISLKDDKLNLDINSHSVTGHTKIKLNTWHHIIVTVMKGTTNIYYGAKLYVNNAPQNPMAFMGAGFDTGTTKGLQIGSDHSQRFHFNGLIDDLRIYDKDIPQSEVQKLYDLGKAAVTVIASKPPVTCRYARIDSLKCVEMAEFELFSKSLNWARTGTAKQSSTYNNAGAQRAVDGNKEASARQNSISNTRGGVSWWELDLGKEVEVERINIFKRLYIIKGRWKPYGLNDFKINLLDKDRRPVWAKIVKSGSRIISLDVLADSSQPVEVVKEKLPVKENEAIETPQAGDNTANMQFTVLEVPENIALEIGLAGPATSTQLPNNLTPEEFKKFYKMLIANKCKVLYSLRGSAKNELKEVLRSVTNIGMWRRQEGEFLRVPRDVGAVAEITPKKIGSGWLIDYNFQMLLEVGKIYMLEDKYNPHLRALSVREQGIFKPGETNVFLKTRSLNGKYMLGFCTLESNEKFSEPVKDRFTVHVTYLKIPNVVAQDIGLSGPAMGNKLPSSFANEKMFSSYFNSLLKSNCNVIGSIYSLSSPGRVVNARHIDEVVAFVEHGKDFKNQGRDIGIQMDTTLSKAEGGAYNVLLSSSLLIKTGEQIGPKGFKNPECKALNVSVNLLKMKPGETRTVLSTSSNNTSYVAFFTFRKVK